MKSRRATTRGRKDRGAGGRLVVAAAIAAAVVVAAPTAARAGRGGSAARIKNAIATGSDAAIIAEIERAETLVCGGCIQPVMSLLDHPDYEVREAAAWWFARRPAQKAKLETQSIANMKAANTITVRNAADILGTFRLPQAIPALSAAIVRDDVGSEARAHIAHALGRIGNKAANPALAAAMGDPSADVRYAAAKAWFHIRHQQGAAPLVPLLSDKSATVRREAASVIGQYRESSGVAKLESMLANDPDAAARRDAAWALGQIGDPGARGALAAATGDPSPLVRQTAEIALKQLQ